MKLNLLGNKFHTIHQDQLFTLEIKKKNILFHGIVQPKAAISLNDIVHNRASMSFIGHSTFSITNLKEDYAIEHPSMVVNGLFSGTTEMECGGTSTIKCKKNDLIATLSWNNKRDITGKIKKESKTIYKIVGKYQDDVFVLSVNDKFQKKHPFLNVTKITPTKKSVRLVKEQDKMESRKVWYQVSKFIDDLKYEEANKVKTIIEDAQRKMKKNKENEN